MDEESSAGWNVASWYSARLMSLGAAALFASAFVHALWNALLKRERSPQVAVAGVLSWAAVIAVGVALLSGGIHFPSRRALGWGVAAGVFEGTYFITLAAALIRAKYGVVYTIARGGAMLIVWPAGALLLHEPLSARGALGACIVGIGLFLVAGGHTRAGSQRGGRTFAALCAASIAGYHLCYDRALAAGAREGPLFAVALVVALPFVFASLRGRVGTGDPPSRRDQMSAMLRWAVAGALSASSFLLFLFGLRSSSAAVALTLRNTSVVFAQGLSLALGERPTRAQVIGAVLVAVGAALVVRA